ncbi:2TM domain-containing protein [Flavobacteriaceae bacterium MAR_2010_72]|nr:2TM domain-containing protein [Flavobacteriaceae bacterium MAR_2010_72]
MRPYNKQSFDDLDETAQRRFLREEAYLRAQKHVKKISGFYRHLIAYVIINLFLIGIIAFNSNGNIWHFGTFSTAFFWGIGLAFHAMGVFGPNIMFGKNWEDRKIKDYMDKDKTRWE